MIRNMAKIETICPLCEEKSKSESRLDSCPVCGANLINSKEVILKKADTRIYKDVFEFDFHAGVLLLSNQRIFWVEQPSWENESSWFKPWFTHWFLRLWFGRKAIGVFLSPFFDYFFPYPKVMKFSFRLDEITEAQIKDFRRLLRISTMIDGETVVVDITQIGGGTVVVHTNHGMYMHIWQWQEWVDAINDAKERFLAENYANTRVVKSFSDILPLP